MKTNAYLDTNIYVYVALRNRMYYEKCRAILYDAYSGRIRAYGSPMVAVELLGSLSRVDARLAHEALKAYLAMPVVNLEITSEVLLLASLVNTIVNIGYDAVHASLLLLNGVDTVVTNDVDDWVRFRRSLPRIVAEARGNGFAVEAEDIRVVTPDTYPNPLT